MKTYAYVTTGGIVQFTSSLHEDDSPPSVPGLECIVITATIPQNSNQQLKYHLATYQWIDPRTLQDHKDAKWSEIKQARGQAEYAGFSWDGSTFDSDATSQNRITGAVTLAQLSPSFSIDWTLKDNSVRTLSQADMLQVGAALGQHVASQFARAQALRAQIEAATTVQQVDAVIW